MSDSSPAGPALDAALARQWLGILHGDSSGLVHICSTGDWAGRTFTDLDAATNYVRYLDGEGREGIYVRVTTLRGALAPGRRGGAVDTAALPALWADLDLAGPGHAEQDLPPDEAAGRAIIATTGLPEPTLWIHSGGGLYPIWLLDKPLLLAAVDGHYQHTRGANYETAVRLARDWQRVIEHATAASGYRYGRGVGDLARVLRVVGTVNRKEGLTRPCRILSAGPNRYTVEQLVAALDAAMSRIAPPAARAISTSINIARGPDSLRPDGTQPGDDFNARADWLADILVPAGWREHYRADEVTYVTRPGKPTGISASINALGTDRLHVFTTSAPPLEGGESYSKFGAYTLLRFGTLDADTLKKAASELAKSGYGVRVDLAAENRAALAELLGPPPANSSDLHQSQQARNIIPPAEQRPEPTPPPPTIAAAGGGRYFTDTGAFLAATLAADILTAGPLAVGADDIMWQYCGGVWSPARHAVRDRATELLGERYRRGHASNVEDIVRARVERISCEPVPELINFRNGLLDWRTSQLRNHSPDVPTTVQLPHNWTPGAPCPRFDAFLDEIVPADMVATVWELIGYLMYSGNPLHKAVMLMGKGRNGKGTLLRVVVALLGKHNVTAASLHDLTGTRFTTASLFGKIANIAGDIDATYLESTAVFKAITGQDQISAEHKGRDRFDFTPWAVPVFSANEIPPSADTTTGYLSRWLAIPFPADFTGREDRTLDAKLHAEIPGIAAKAIPALCQLMARGDFEITESGRAAYDEFVRRVDQVRAWIGDCCDIAPGPHEANAHPFEPRAALYRAYRDWCARDNHKPLAASKFYDRLSAAGATQISLNGTRGYRGLRIVDAAGTLGTEMAGSMLHPGGVR